MEELFGGLDEGEPVLGGEGSGGSRAGIIKVEGR